MATTKPCPACKEVYRDRKADDVCCDCRRLIEEARKARELDAKEVGDDKAIFRVPQSWPHFFAVKHRPHGLAVSEGYEALQKAFVGVLTAMGDHMVCGDRLPGTDQEWQQQTRGERVFSAPINAQATDGGCRSLMKASRSDVQAVVALDAAVRKALDAVAESCYRKGHSLLTGLASGDMSVQDFNKATVDTGRRDS